ncbi:MAG: RluA family pseudouridine synthase [Akkermansiaceae bacterium]|nr:RluA family pseudouridine synthase [Akkermansiaceae bacterium]
MILTFSEATAQRLDAFLAGRLSGLSRSQIQNLIKGGHILLNDKLVKARASLKKGDLITVSIPEKSNVEPDAEDLPLSVLYEDDEIIFLNKAHGMVVHPAAGNANGTLVNALLHHCAGKLASEGGEGRPGIVHRLDKDTSGCIVAAKTNTALKNLVGQFADRTTAKLYLAVTQSLPKETHQTVSNNIARHPVHRQRMDVCNPGAGKQAITDLHLLHTADDGTSLVLCALHTGRTHQIRVHNRFLGHPLLGDPLYSKPNRQPVSTGRLMLHAWRLGITHPLTSQWIQQEAQIPNEFLPWTDKVTERLNQVRLIQDYKKFDALW